MMSDYFFMKMIELPNTKTARAMLYISKGNEKSGLSFNSPTVDIKDHEKSYDALEKWGFQKGHNQLLKPIEWSMYISGLSRGSYDDLRTHGTFATFISKSTRYCDEFKLAPWFYEHYTVEQCARDINAMSAVKDMVDVPHDIKRGHLPLSIETPFVFKVNALHFMHIYSTRKDHAHGEIKVLLNDVIDTLVAFGSLYDHEDSAWLGEMLNKYCRLG